MLQVSDIKFIIRKEMINASAVTNHEKMAFTET